MQALLRLESTGAILRGSFTPFNHTTTQSPNQTEWCERRLWRAYIAALSLSCASRSSRSLRHSSCGGCCAGSMPLRARRRLANAARWKCCGSCKGSNFPPARGSAKSCRAESADTTPRFCDQLSLTGAIGWGRLSPHPATLEDSSDGRRRVVPTSVAPITFFLREESDWMRPRRHNGELEASRPQPCRPRSAGIS